ncbi:MAG: iron-sulfur cluster carrier protein [Bacteroidia bacterium]|nr:MAG: iron-sulfur cluster carrier protein [Bacteroidia bacterium]
MTEKDILNALSYVEDPDLKKDLVSLGMIKNIIIHSDKKIAFTVVLTTPACPLKESIKNACIQAIHHFLGKDIAVEVTMSAQVTENKNQKDSLKGIKNVILVGSGKGGVGKSTVAVNLATALAQLGAKVGILDADIYGPSVPILLDLQGKQPYVEPVNGQNKMIPLEQYGMKVMSIGFLVPPEQALAWRGPMASKALHQLVFDTLWGELDYLVVDLPPGTGDIHITMAQMLPVTGAIIVTTPQQVAVADSLKAITMFQNPHVNVKVLGIIENMAYFIPDDAPEKKYFIFGKGGAEKLAKFAKVNLLGQIPIQEQISINSDEGKPIALNVDNFIGKTFHEIAQTIAQQIAILNFKT